MRIHDILALLLLGTPTAVLATGGQAQVTAPAHETPAPRMSLVDFKRLHDAGGVIVLDVRGEQSYREGHIPGAVSAPLETLGSAAASWRGAKKPVVAYCS